MRTRFGRLVIVAAVAVLLGALAPPASADPPGAAGAVTRGTAPGDYVYWEGDVVVLAGNDSFADGCAGNGFQVADALNVSPGNGSFLSHQKLDDIEILVFEVSGIASVDDLFMWLGAACLASEQPEPVASGTGDFRGSNRVTADGVVHVHNGLNARVTTTDGRRVHLSTFAKLTIGPAGLDIQQLRVNYGG